MAHVMREEMLRWRDQGLPEDRERVLSHLASCAACTQQYAEIVRTSPAAPVPQHFDPADFVKRGYAVRSKVAHPARAGWLMSWKMWAGVASAAAALALVVSTGLGPTRGSDISTPRGAGIELVAPAVSAMAPTALEWRSGLVPDRFHVEISDSSGAVLYRVETSESRVILPDDVREQIAPGSAYRYTVAALDADGDVVTSAEGTIAPGAAAP